MCTRGVWQLERLTLRYCSRGGSSSGTRAFIRSGLIDFAKEKPHIEIDVVERAGKHPVAVGKYKCGSEKVFPLRKLSSDQVSRAVSSLQSSSGRKLTKFKKDVFSDSPSVQGLWSEGINNSTEEMIIEHLR